MCGRYTHNLTWSEIVALYRLTLPEEPPEKFVGQSYNVAPTHVMPIVRPAGNGRELMMAAWGLVPYWLKPEQLGKQAYSTINARSDRVQTAPTYRDPFRQRRCIIPTTGWYEWQKTGSKTKRPHHFQPAAKPFAFGGVFDIWRGDEGKQSPASRSSPRPRRRARRPITTACRLCLRRASSRIGCVSHRNAPQR
jgi:putative SOS response-associated peptidase YedK